MFSGFNSFPPGFYSNDSLCAPDISPQVSRVSQFVGPTERENIKAMRVSYLLNLKGPSITLHTACSTSLVAVAQAWQALMGYQCYLALAHELITQTARTSEHGRARVVV